MLSKGIPFTLILHWWQLGSRLVSSSVIDSSTGMALKWDDYWIAKTSDVLEDCKAVRNLRLWSKRIGQVDWTFLQFDFESRIHLDDKPELPPHFFRLTSIFHRFNWNLSELWRRFITVEINTATNMSSSLYKSISPPSQQKKRKRRNDTSPFCDLLVSDCEENRMCILMSMSDYKH